MNQTVTLRERLYQFYADHPEFGENGGTGKNDNWVWLDFGFFKFPIPNTQSRKDLVYVHDLNHIVNDYDTTWKGEVSVAGWEIATGMGKHFIGWALALFAMGFGLLVYPSYVYQGFVRGQETKGIVSLNIPKDILLGMTLGELKGMTRHHQFDQNNIIITAKTKWKFVLFGLISVIYFLSPFILGTGLLVMLIS